MKTVPLGDLCTPRQWRALSRKDMLDAGYPVYGANGVIGFSEEFTHTDPVIAVRKMSSSLRHVPLRGLYEGR